MSYRNKSYVIFDGDNDMWAYGFMKGWIKNDHIDFSFHDAHALNTITSRSSEENTKKKLRARLAGTKQAIVLIGESTKNLYRFVRWEMEVCQQLAIPMVATNLNGKREYNPDLCPAILRNADAVHVSFQARIIQHALNDFCENYDIYKGQGENWRYNADVYRGVGL